MCDLVSHDRPRHEPLPHRRAPGVLGRAHPDRAAVRPPLGPGKKGHGNTYAKRIAVLAAYAAANTGTFLGERFGRLSSRPGGGGRKKAGCAVGRSILIIVWHLLNDPAARYRDLGPDWHSRHTDRSRKARNARRQLEALGYDIIITLREDAA
jgi:transposase